MLTYKNMQRHPRDNLMFDARLKAIINMHVPYNAKLNITISKITSHSASHIQYICMLHICSFFSDLLFVL